MTYFLAILMGIVQGVAEFLPISSSGHLSLLQYFYGMEEPDTLFNVLLHFATLMAVCIVYRKDIIDMIQEFLLMIADFFKKSKKTPNDEAPPITSGRKMVLFVILGTLPMIFVFPVKDIVESLGSDPTFISFPLIITGTLLFTADKTAKSEKNLDKIPTKDVVLIGISQGIATIPGLSRSGCTISSALALGIKREVAVRYSFLLSLPAVGGATLLKVFDVVEQGIDFQILPMYLVGMGFAFVVGYFSIQLLQLLAKKGKFGAFSYYCWGMGLISLLSTL